MPVRNLPVPPVPNSGTGCTFHYTNVISTTYVPVPPVPPVPDVRTAFSMPDRPGVPSL
jgi:hypothetical protein